METRQLKLISVLVVKIPFKAPKQNIPAFMEDKDGNIQPLQPKKPPAQLPELVTLKVNEETVLPK